MEDISQIKLTCPHTEGPHKTLIFALVKWSCDMKGLDQGHVAQLEVETRSFDWVKPIILCSHC